MAGATGPAPAPVTAAAPVAVPGGQTVQAKQGDTITDANGNKGTINYDQATGAKLGAGQETVLSLGTSGNASVTPSPSLIVTSGASRSNYSSNVNTLNKATATNSANASSSDPSVVDFLNENKMPSDYNSRAALATKMGITGYTGSASQNTQLLQLLKTANTNTGSGNSSDTTNKNNTTLITSNNNNGGGSSTTIDPNAGGTSTATTTAPVTNADGSVTTTNADGSTTTTNPDGSVTNTDASGNTTPTLPPALQKQYDDAIASLDQGIAQAKADISAAQANLASDPNSIAATNLIEQQYNVQIEAMKQKNALLAGSYTANAARSGMLQYANDMETSFMSEEQDKASARLTDLITKETSAVLKSQQAYQAGDVKALSAASKDLESYSKDKITALNDLMTATDKVVKEKQADVKAAQAQAKQQTTDDIRLSTALGQTVADGIKAAGLTDPTQIKAYISSMATKAGISNPDILSSAVTKAQQTTSKFNLSQSNVQSEINKRGSTGGGKTGSSKFNVSTGISKVGPQMKNAAGADGYIDPDQWVAARQNWNALGGTDASFNSNFKKYLNPASYAKAGFTAPKGAAVASTAAPADQYSLNGK